MRQHALEAAQRLIEREREQLILRRHVVVDRRLREAEPFGEHPDRGGVVAVLVEGGDGDLEDAALVVAGAAAAEAVSVIRLVWHALPRLAYTERTISK